LLDDNNGAHFVFRVVTLFFQIAKKISGIQESKKSNLSSMGDLASSLKDIVSSSRKGLKAGKKLSNKQKKKLLSKEVENFCAVMEHPAFKNAPIDTINEHITNTLKDQKVVHCLSIANMR